VEFAKGIKGHLLRLAAGVTADEMEGESSTKVHRESSLALKARSFDLGSHRFALPTTMDAIDPRVSSSAPATCA
jgi:hypothetical protein